MLLESSAVIYSTYTASV